MTRINPLRWIDKAFQKNPEKALAYTTVASIVIKDGIGCYKYVTQSRNNKEIPKERRNFVAALDLTNGVLMILAQIGMFALMRKYSEPLFDKLFKNSFGDKALVFLGEKVRMLQKLAGDNASRKIEIAKEVKDIRKDGLEAFKYIAELSAATILGKRVIVPFIATPLANIVKGRMEEKDNLKEANAVEKSDDIEEDDD
jgi:hypothetical protein